MPIFQKITKMMYCKKCQGQYMADVEVTARQYGENIYISYKTLRCPCGNGQTTQEKLL